jgi:hypothetical protein
MPPVWMECPVNIEKYTEPQWQAAVMQVAAHYGWMVTHVRSMQYNDSGLPDLLLFRGGQYRLFELKTMNKRSKLRPSQERWLERASAFDVEVNVLRPCPQDWSLMQALLD